jgi:hypothetical protein
MWTRAAPIVLGVVVLGAGAIALTRSGAPSEPPAPAATVSDRDRAGASQNGMPPGHPPVANAEPAEPAAPGAAQPSMAPAGGQGAPITWTVPSDWQTVPNPSPMRLATYRVPGPSADAAEMAVARAGGSTDANIERWRGQFAGGTDDKPKRVEKTVHGLKVTIVELAGTYTPTSMMPGAAPGEPRPGWALLAAIVETQGSPYFFKLVGPSAAIRAARAHFDGLIASISPS